MEFLTPQQVTYTKDNTQVVFNNKYLLFYYFNGGTTLCIPSDEEEIQEYRFPVLVTSLQPDITFKICHMKLSKECIVEAGEYFNFIPYKTLPVPTGKTVDVYLYEEVDIEERGEEKEDEEPGKEKR